MNDFKPSGNQTEDIESFLKLTGRSNYLEGIRSGKIDPEKFLNEIKEFQKKSQGAESDLDKQNGIKNESSEAEIKAIDSILKNPDEADEIGELEKLSKTTKKKKATNETSRAHEDEK